MRLPSVFFASALAIAAAGTAEAATISFDFRSGSGTTSTNSGSGYGNVRTFTAGGVTVTATSWSLTGYKDSFQSSQLGRFSTGLGSCNRDEGTGCNSPTHQVDNVGDDDFVLFQFSAAVDPASIRIDPYGNYDRDVSYWVGTAATPLNLTGSTLGGLGALGFGSRMDSDAGTSNSARDVSIEGGVVNSILFGARVGSDQDDYFKIISMIVDYNPPPPAVPAPAALTLMGTGLLGLGLANRRRRRRG
jgi:hypothetical protein